jgi:hypothetical protein
MIFIDFEYLEDEKNRLTWINLINNEYNNLILLTNDKNNIKKAYSYGVKIFIVDAISKSVDSIEIILKQLNKSEIFVHPDTHEYIELTWDTLNVYNQLNIDLPPLKSPYDNLRYCVFSTLEMPNWMNHQ